MKELLEMIAKALVNHPEEVEVRSVEGQQVIVLELCVHSTDGDLQFNPHFLNSQAAMSVN